MRPVVLSGEGFALAEVGDGDLDRLELSAEDDRFDVDADDRPKPWSMTVHRLVVVDAATDELLGVVSWLAKPWGRTLGCGAWNVGIVLLPTARRRGLGVAATRLLVRHLFETGDLDRVEASTDVANTPAQRTLERAGFQREGVVRGAQLRGGIRRDLVLYGLLRTDCYS